MSELPVIKELTLGNYLEQLASDSLFPSAGASAGTTAAQGAALFAMVCQVNLRKLREKGVGGDEECGIIRWNGKDEDGAGLKRFWERMERETLEQCRRLLALAQGDGEAYLTVVAGDPNGPANSIEVPLRIAASAGAAVGLIEESYLKSYPPVRADADTARCLLRGAYLGALAVGRYNLPLLPDREQRSYYVNLISELQSSAPGAELLLPA